MARQTKPVVHRSIESARARRCVDILQRPDGCWSYIECRRDPEDPHGWRPLIAAGHPSFASAAAATAAARAAIRWLSET